MAFAFHDTPEDDAIRGTNDDATVSRLQVVCLAEWSYHQLTIVQSTDLPFNSVTFKIPLCSTLFVGLFGDHPSLTEVENAQSHRESYHNAGKLHRLLYSQLCAGFACTTVSTPRYAKEKADRIAGRRIRHSLFLDESNDK